MLSISYQVKAKLVDLKCYSFASFYTALITEDFAFHPVRNGKADVDGC